MTTATTHPARPAAAGQSRPTPPPTTAASRVASYLGSSLRIALTDAAFLGFIIAMPTVMYKPLAGPIRQA